MPFHKLICKEIALEVVCYHFILLGNFIKCVKADLNVKLLFLAETAHKRCQRN